MIVRIYTDFYSKNKGHVKNSKNHTNHNHLQNLRSNNYRVEIRTQILMIVRIYADFFSKNKGHVKDSKNLTNHNHLQNLRSPILQAHHFFKLNRLSAADFNLFTAF